MKSSTATKTDVGPVAQAAVLSKAVARAAERMGISAAFLSRIERGERGCSLELLRAEIGRAHV